MGREKKVVEGRRDVEEKRGEARKGEGRRGINWRG
jgi:hypothetical protein